VFVLKYPKVLHDCILQGGDYLRCFSCPLINEFGGHGDSYSGQKGPGLPALADCPVFGAQNRWTLRTWVYKGAQPAANMKILHDFTRWMYRGQRPNWIARIMNRASAVVASSGVSRMVTLEVAGRKSGRIASLPLVMAVVDGERYLVSMLGEDVQWVWNVRAAGGRAVLRSGGREEIQLEEIPTAERAPILKAYLQRAPGARPHVPVNKDAPLAEFEKIAAAFPVFRIASIKA